MLSLNSLSPGAAVARPCSRKTSNLRGVIFGSVLSSSITDKIQSGLAEILCRDGEAGRMPCDIFGEIARETGATVGDIDCGPDEGDRAERAVEASGLPSLTVSSRFPPGLDGSAGKGDTAVAWLEICPVSGLSRAPGCSLDRIATAFRKLAARGVAVG